MQDTAWKNKVQKIIDQNKGNRKLNQWEKDFLASLDSQLKAGRDLTAAQVDKLMDIDEK